MDIQSKLKFMSLYRMVLADNIIEPSEMQKLRQIGNDHYGLSNEAMDKIIIEDLAEMPAIDSKIEKIMLLYEMALIAWADNDLDESEKKLLCEYAYHFGVEKNSINTLVNFLLESAHNNKSMEDVLSNFK